jgi:hypothetical protein
MTFYLTIIKNGLTYIALQTTIKLFIYTLKTSFMTVLTLIGRIFEILLWALIKALK